MNELAAKNLLRTTVRERAGGGPKLSNDNEAGRMGMNLIFSPKLPRLPQSVRRIEWNCCSFFVLIIHSLIYKTLEEDERRKPSDPKRDKKCHHQCLQISSHVPFKFPGPSIVSSLAVCEITNRTSSRGDWNSSRTASGGCGWPRCELRPRRRHPLQRLTFVNCPRRPAIVWSLSSFWSPFFP